MVRMLHAGTKQELAELIVKCAPVNATRFQVVKRIRPNGFLIDYGRDGLSIYKLGVELGLIEKKPKPEEKVQGQYFPSAKALDAMNKRKTGLVILD